MGTGSHQRELETMAATLLLSSSCFRCWRGMAGQGQVNWSLWQVALGPELHPVGQPSLFFADAQRMGMWTPAAPSSVFS